MRKFFVLAALALLFPLVTFATTCPNLTRNLSRGMTGNDVLQLQQFLVERGHLSQADMNTGPGTFGARTERAVQRFQCAQNIVCSGTPNTTGYGAVGPRTRAAIRDACAAPPPPPPPQCPVVGVPSCIGGVIESLGVDQRGCQIGYRCVGGQAQTPQGTLTASPQTGAAPLFVTLTYTAQQSGSYTLDFGDNTEAQTVTATAQAATVNHAYTTAGTYTAKLKTSSETVASVSIAVQAGCTGQNCARPNSCPALDQVRRILKRGMSGPDVAALQDYLGENPAIYPEHLTTGYFGAATERAVQRWQAAHNIVSSGDPETTGWGVVGPKTIKAMREACGLAPLPPNPTSTSTPATAQRITLSAGQIVFLGGVNIRLDAIAEESVTLVEIPSGADYITYFFSSPVILAVGEQAEFGYATITLVEVNEATQRATFAVVLKPAAGSLTASPSSGPPPLTVTFTGSITATSYRVDFGDGTDPKEGGGGGGSGVKNVREVHVYQTTGTYTAKLEKMRPCGGPPGTSCTAQVQYDTEATATITVTAAPTSIPIIDSLTPSEAKPGDKVTMKGKHLAGINSIFVNGTIIGVFAATNDTTLEFTIPAPFPAGSYTLTVSNANGTSQGAPIRILPVPQSTTPTTTPVLSACYMNGTGYPIDPLINQCGVRGGAAIPKDGGPPSTQCQEFALKPACSADGWINVAWGGGYINPSNVTVGCTSFNTMASPYAPEGVIYVPGNMRVFGNRCIAEGGDGTGPGCEGFFVCKRDGWWQVDGAGFEFRKLNKAPWIAPENFYPSMPPPG